MEEFSSGLDSQPWAMSQAGVRDPLRHADVDILAERSGGACRCLAASECFAWPSCSCAIFTSVRIFDSRMGLPVPVAKTSFPSS